MIRVLQIGMHDQMGGIENFIMNYYRFIDRKKVQFDFLIPYKDGSYYDDEIKQLGGKIYYFTFKNDKNIIKFMHQLNNFFKNNHYDIVHCSDTGLGVFYLYYAKKYNCKIRIAHSHSTNVESGLKGVIKKILQKHYIKLANRYFACSVLAGEYLFGKKEFTVVKNAIDYTKYYFNEIQRQEVRNQLKLKEEILIGNIGRLSEEKNQKFLVELMKSMPLNYKLLIIGEGPAKGMLENRIKEYRLEERVIMMQPQIDVNRYYNAMDVFVLPSRYEGLGIVAIEAQVNGLKCVLSNEVTTEVAITDGVKFIAPSNIEEWKKYILELDKKRTSGVKNDYNIQENVKKLEELYRLV